MIFMQTAPSTWKELQDFATQLLNQMGYHAISPCTIDTVRGKVEVDILVDCPDVFVKRIICECKFWKTPVTKEKVHAFRTVVHDSGAALGVLISQVGFQSGAIEAAMFSNVKLVTWEEFVQLVSDQWIIETLKRIKRQAGYVSEYLNYLHFPYEQLKKDDVIRYNNADNRYRDVKLTCLTLRKRDLINDGPILASCYAIEKYNSIVDYLSFLEYEINSARAEFEIIVGSSGIIIDEERLNKPEAFIFANLY